MLIVSDDEDDTVHRSVTAAVLRRDSRRRGRGSRGGPAGRRCAGRPAARRGSRSAGWARHPGGRVRAGRRGCQRVLVAPECL